MTGPSLGYKMFAPDLNLMMIKETYRYADNIKRLETLVHDGTSSLKIRKAAAKEKMFQMEDLEELKLRMKNSESGFTRIIYYKYIEGYSIEEIALALCINKNTVAINHAAFTKYMEQPIEDIPINNSLYFKRYIERLEEFLNPKYETCCTHCGSTTVIPQDLVKKVFTDETRKVRAVARG